MIRTNCVPTVLKKKSLTIPLLSIVSIAKVLTPYAGIQRKDLASLGCPFPDDDGAMCSECSHNSVNSIFTGQCDLGIKIV